MLIDNDKWYQSIPTFNNQESRSLESFQPNEKYEDELFLTCTNSLIDENERKAIIDNYSSKPNNEDNKKKKGRVNNLDLVTEWIRIPELFQNYQENQKDKNHKNYLNYDLFPPKLHCDTFCQGYIGDCYFLDVISLVSNYGGLLTRLFPIKKKNDHGYYEVILFINGWKRVIVDDYIPVIKKGQRYEPLGCDIKEYENEYCFYFMLLEKAWAKVNKNYYNIYEGSSSNALLILTGFYSERINLIDFSNFTSEIKNKILEDMSEGIKRNGHLYGVNTKGHAYCLVDIETIYVNERKYRILKIRNPHGKTGAGFLGKDENLLAQFKNRRDIVEDELKDRYKNFNKTEDSGIFFISEKYFFELFESYCKCYHFFETTTIEFLLSFNNEEMNKRYFLFKLTVEENSLVQLNLTTHYFDNKGRMNFYYSNRLRNRNYCYIKIRPYVGDGSDKDENNPIKKIPEGTYYVECHYYNEAPKEILFWANYKGKIKLDFIGMSEHSYIEEYYNSMNNSLYSDKGVTFKYDSYQISKKLGEYYERKANLYEIAKDIIGCDINAEEEDKGFSLIYQENDNVAFSFVIDKENMEKNKLFSQNKDFPEYTFVGNVANCRKIINNGNIYRGKELVYTGKINFNLFPQFIQEDNNNTLIAELEDKRFRLSNEIKEDELVRINISNRANSFKGQLTKLTHPHALTKCITTNRTGWRCDHCNKSFNNRRKSYYCSICDFDFCGNNCSNPQARIRNKTPHYEPTFHFRTLQHRHYLVKVKLFDEKNIFKCYSCLKEIPDNTTLYYCTKCDFRLCRQCQINETRGKYFQFITSWHDHPLTFCKTKGIKKDDQEKRCKNTCGIKILKDSDFFFTCNHCGIEYSREKDSFYCTACNFYICMKCYKDYFFYDGRDIENAIEVNMGNKEVFPVYCRCYLSNDNSIQVSKCKYCEIDINLNNFTYYCSNCSSTFCNNCYKSHKVIFHNNVLIFDGTFRQSIKHGFGITYKYNNEINYSGTWNNDIYNLISHNIPHKHNLKRNYFNDSIQCDICLKLCDSNDHGVSCRECNLDICDNCIIALNSKLMRSPYCNYDLKIGRSTKSYNCAKCWKNKNSIFFKYDYFFNLKTNYYCLQCFEAGFTIK